MPDTKVSIEEKIKELEKLVSELEIYDEYEKIVYAKEVAGRLHKIARTIESQVTEYTIGEKGLPYCERIRGEFGRDMVAYLNKYIFDNKINMNGRKLSYSLITANGVEIVFERQKDNKNFKLDRLVNRYIQYPYKIVSELLGIEISLYWMNQSNYEQFKKIRQKNPDWVEKYCQRYIEVLDTFPKYE